MSAAIHLQTDHLLALESEARHWLLAPKRSKAFLRGQHRSRALGRGLDFSELRGYQPGDDIRHIHWKASAKTGKVYSKLFSEEREKPVIILLDQTSNLFFASKVRMKSVQASLVAGYLSWFAQLKGDRLGGLIVGESNWFAQRPSNKKNQLLAWLDTIGQANRALNAQSQSQMDWSLAFAELLALRAKGADIFLISDFHGLQPEHLAPLHSLSQHNHINVIQVVDPKEVALPNAKEVTLTHGHHSLSLSQLGQKGRRQYEQAMAQQRAEIKRVFKRLNANFHELQPADDALTFLQDHGLIQHT